MKEKAVLALIVHFNFQNVFRYHDIAVYSYCILPKPYCISKSSVNIHQTEDKYSFLCGILASGRQLDTHREQLSHYNLFSPNFI